MDEGLIKEVEKAINEEIKAKNMNLSIEIIGIGKHG
jgi:hypothetical protein